MADQTQLDALLAWFDEYDTINLAQAKAGLPMPYGDGPKVHIERVAPLIFQLRNSGWTITTERDLAGVAFYKVWSRPEALAPGSPSRVSPKREPKADVKADAKWMCSKPGCISGVVTDDTTVFDSRYTTGRCFTHGKTVLVRR